MKTNILNRAITILGTAMISIHAVQAQPGTARTVLQRQDLSVPGHEVVQIRVEINPGIDFPKHSHPGEEVIYVLAGSLEYQIEDRAPVTLKAGDVYFIPPGAIHSAKNVGNVTGVELATLIVEKGKPILTIVK